MSNITNKEPLLFLCHRIPFPPNKGDKIRSFNMLKYLSTYFDIYLGCFIDDPHDRRYVENLTEWCVESKIINLNPTTAKVKSLIGFVTREPLTIPYYNNSELKKWIFQICTTHKIKQAFVFSSSMAQYLPNSQFNAMHKVIDFVDVDSDKWRQYAEKKTGIAKWIFHREHRLLADHEDIICAEFDHSLFVSPDEAQLFRDRQPSQEQAKVHGLLNGVDVDFFNPSAQFSVEPLVPKQPFIVFTGAMDYWANIDAVLWFVEQVWPFIIQEQPEIIFCVVGGNPSSEILALANRKNIVVTGRVEDIRPFIAESSCVVAPLQIARGIQNKVLEAMSLNKPVVVTSMAMEGINAETSNWIKIENEAKAFALSCMSFFSRENDELPINNRLWIKENFTWQQALKRLHSYFT